MKLVKSLQKTLQPFTKMVKKNNKLMLLLGVLLLLGLVLLVKMYMKKREGFNDNENEIVLNNIGIESVKGGWKMVHSNNSTKGLKEARFTSGAPKPLTIEYNKSDNTFTIHASAENKVWNFVWSNSWANDSRSPTGDDDKNAEFRSNEYVGIKTADKMRIFFTGKDSNDNPKYKIASDAGLFLGWWSIPTETDFKNAAFNKKFNGDEFYFIDINNKINNNYAKIDLFAKISEKEMSELKTKFDLDVQPTDIDNAFTKISEKEKTNKMSGLKTKFGLDVQPTDIDNAFTKINTKYTTDLKKKIQDGLGVELTDTNTVNTVVGKAKTKYEGLQTVLKNQGFMYRPAPTPSPTPN